MGSAHGCTYNCVNTQVHRTEKIAPFGLVISRKPEHLVPDAEPELEDTDNTDLNFKWLNRLKALMITERKEMDATQRGYKIKSYQRVRLPQQEVTIGSHVYVWKQHFGTTEIH